MKKNYILISMLVSVSGVLSCTKESNKNKQKSGLAEAQPEGPKRLRKEFLDKYKHEVLVYIANEPTEAIAAVAGQAAQPLQEDHLYKAVHGAGVSTQTGDVWQLFDGICGGFTNARTRELFVVTNQDLKRGKIRHCVAGGADPKFVDVSIDFPTEALAALQPLTYTEGSDAVILSKILQAVAQQIDSNKPGNSSQAISLILKSHGSQDKLMVGCRKGPAKLEGIGASTLGGPGGDPLSCETGGGLTAEQINKSIAASGLKFEGSVFLESCRSAIAARTISPTGKITPARGVVSLLDTITGTAFSTWTSDNRGLFSKTITNYGTLIGRNAKASFALRLDHVLDKCVDAEDGAPDGQLQQCKTVQSEFERWEETIPPNTNE